MYVITGLGYDRLMSDDGLPHPSEALTVSELVAELDRVIAMLEQGGAILLYTDDQQRQLGVLTQNRRLLDAASIAAMIDTGHLPPLDDLVAMDDRGELR